MDPCDRCGDPEARMFDECEQCGPKPLCWVCRIVHLDEIAEERAHRVRAI